MIQSKSTKPYIIFDFDGTIADSLPLIIQTYQQLTQKYKLTAVSDQEILAWRSKSAREILKLSGISVFKIIPILNEGKRIFSRHINQVQPIPGIADALHQLSATHHLGIITSNSTANVHDFLQRHNLQIFSFIHSDNTVFGKADVIKKALKQYHIPPSQVVYVGDEIRDIHAARRAGILCLSVSWGLNTRESLSNHRPAKIIDAPQELTAALQLNSE